MKYLIVVDMQNDFITGSLGTKEAEAILSKVIEKVKSFDGTVIYTKDTHQNNYLTTQEGKNLPIPHCIRKTQGWKINKEVKAALKAADCPVIRVEKPTFGSLDLTMLIRQDLFEEECSVELVGLCTDICVVSNALLLKANFPEMPISVDSACVAGVTPESNEAALTTMKMCQIQVM